jgi:hypothetical protein
MMSTGFRDSEGKYLVHPLFAKLLAIEAFLSIVRREDEERAI